MVFRTRINYIIRTVRPPATPQGPFRYPLTAALGSEGGVRVLRELLAHGGAVDTTQLLRGTRLTRQTVLAALERLVQLRLVLPVGTGRYRSYQADAAHPLVPALGALFVAEAARVERVFAAVRAAAAADRAIAAVWLYGSVARGEDVPGSDVDLALVVLESRRLDATLDAFRDRVRPVEEAEYVTMSVIAIGDDDVRRLAGGDPWWTTMARDAVPLVGKAPADYARRLAGGGPPSAPAKASRSRAGKRP